MAEFLTTRGVNTSIERILANATEKLILISPYINFVQPDYIERMKYALERKVRVVLVCRDSFNIHYNEMDKLKTLTGLEFYEHPDVHAKAYFNEREAVITSFNLSGASEANNIEFGMSFTAEFSKDSYDRLVMESDRIIRHSRPVPFAPVRSEGPSLINVSSFKFEGICIRCGLTIPFNPAKPFCYNCYDTWRQYGNSMFVEKHCHQCGSKNRSTTMAQPVCQDCKN